LNERLLYDYATKSRSDSIHRALYGSRAMSMRAANLQTRFRFECQRTGNCCRARHRTSNRIVGDSQLLRIEAYCARLGREVGGVDRWRKTLTLDATQALSGPLVATAGQRGSTSLGFVGGAGTCQFLGTEASPDDCFVQPVKPWVCKLAPVGLIFEHKAIGGLLLLAVQEKPECLECMNGKEWSVGEWLEANISVAQFNDWINDERGEAGWPRILF
jgi:Fe-S-cluster containining protein